jgi:hypothetical protein
MIAIRTHWNPAEAALEKTPLDNYEVPCALLYENANLYGRAPLQCQSVWSSVTIKPIGRCAS